MNLKKLIILGMMGVISVRSDSIVSSLSAMETKPSDNAGAGEAHAGNDSQSVHIESFNCNILVPTDEISSVKYADKLYGDAMKDEKMFVGDKTTNWGSNSPEFNKLQSLLGGCGEQAFACIFYEMNDDEIIQIVDLINRLSPSYGDSVFPFVVDISSDGTPWYAVIAANTNQELASKGAVFNPKLVDSEGKNIAVSEISCKIDSLLKQDTGEIHELPPVENNNVEIKIKNGNVEHKHIDDENSSQKIIKLDKNEIEKVLNADYTNIVLDGIIKKVINSELSKVCGKLSNDIGALDARIVNINTNHSTDISTLTKRVDELTDNLNNGTYFKNDGEATMNLKHLASSGTIDTLQKSLKSLQQKINGLESQIANVQVTNNQPIPQGGNYPPTNVNRKKWPGQSSVYQSKPFSEQINMSIKDQASSDPFGGATYQPGHPRKPVPQGQNVPPQRPVPRGQNVPPQRPVPQGQNTLPQRPVPQGQNTLPQRPVPRPRPGSTTPIDKNFTISFNRKS